MDTIGFMTKVLVTGISGFLGSHTAIQLLERGYHVVGTVRAETQAARVRALLASHVKGGRLDIAMADLLDPQAWPELMKGVDTVMHIASPFPRYWPKREDDIIRPAVDGTISVMRAATVAGVRKMVLTSSIAAMLYGKTGPYRQSSYGEETWTDVAVRADTNPYLRSKALAERAAWDFIDEDSSGMSLVTICPAAILGPVLDSDFGTSASIVLKLMDGSMPLMPRVGFELIDVRCVADLHIRAMESDLADNHRFAAAEGYRYLGEIADVLREAYPSRKIPKRYMPDVLVRLAALVDKSIRPVLVELGAERKVNHGKANNLLDWHPRSVDTSILSCADSLIKFQVV